TAAADRESDGARAAVLVLALGALLVSGEARAQSAWARGDAAWRRGDFAAADSQYSRRARERRAPVEVLANRAAARAQQAPGDTAIEAELAQLGARDDRAGRMSASSGSRSNARRNVSSARTVTPRRPSSVPRLYADMRPARSSRAPSCASSASIAVSPGACWARAAARLASTSTGARRSRARREYCESAAAKSPRRHAASPRAHALCARASPLTSNAPSARTSTAARAPSDSRSAAAVRTTGIAPRAARPIAHPAVSARANRSPPSAARDRPRDARP
ncbi:MAG: hypothetical protein RL721_1712, partial [Candidatus Eisenbacteria bacterium]